MLDDEDNCVIDANPDQTNDDVPQDGYGNACDGDLTGDGVVGGGDFSLFRGCWLLNAEGSPWSLLCDHDGDRALTDADYRLFKRSLRRAKPGPSGLLP